MRNLLLAGLERDGTNPEKDLVSLLSILAFLDEDDCSTAALLRAPFKAAPG